MLCNRQANFGCGWFLQRLIVEDIIVSGDFGISRILEGSTDIATTFTGTPYFMAPEILKHEGYNSKSDIW